MVTVGRHSDNESVTLHTWVPRVIFGYSALVLVIGALTLTWILIGSNSDGPPDSGSAAGSLSGERLPVGSASTNSEQDAFGQQGSSTHSGADLVANAKKVKPLEDIQKGDRVIYRGQVCTWQVWSKNMNTSTIKCSGRDRFQTPTARLTPVELKVDD